MSGGRPATHDASFLLLLRAIDRHMSLAYELAEVGEYEAATDAIDDAFAIAAELDCSLRGSA